MGTLLKEWGAPDRRAGLHGGAGPSVDEAVVLAAVDVSDSADMSLARRIVETARAVSLNKLHVVNVCHVVGESVLACGTRGIGRERLKQLRRRWARARLERLECLVRPGEADLHVVHGRPGRSVRRLARKLRASVVVMGQPESSSLMGSFRGRAREALSGGPYSVLLVPRDVSIMHEDGDTGLRV